MTSSGGARDDLRASAALPAMEPFAHKKKGYFQQGYFGIGNCDSMSSFGFGGGGAGPSMSDFASMSFDQMASTMGNGAPLGGGQRRALGGGQRASLAAPRLSRSRGATPARAQPAPAPARGRRRRTSRDGYLDDDPDIVAALGSAMAASAAQQQRQGHRQHRPAPPADGNDYEALLALDESVKKRGVTQRERLRLAVFSASRKDTKDADGTPASCLICMERVRERASVLRMPCGHLFHEPCIAKWLDSNRTCPTCRKEIPDAG